MLIDISKVLSQAGLIKNYTCEIDFDSVDVLGNSYSIINQKPFELCLVNDEDSKIYISGHASVTLLIPCDRCLEDVEHTVDFTIDRELDLENGVIIAGEDEDITYIDDSSLDTSRLIFDEILVNWPSKMLCKDDCKGLCLKCGQNLNIAECDCDRTVLDPRMAAFQDVFREFKEV